MNVRCTLLNIVAMHTGRLLALANMKLNFDGVVAGVNSIVLPLAENTEKAPS